MRLSVVGCRLWGCLDKKAQHMDAMGRAIHVVRSASPDNRQPTTGNQPGPSGYPLPA